AQVLILGPRASSQGKVQSSCPRLAIQIRHQVTSEDHSAIRQFCVGCGCRNMPVFTSQALAPFPNADVERFIANGSKPPRQASPGALGSKVIAPASLCTGKGPFRKTYPCRDS